MAQRSVLKIVSRLICRWRGIGNRFILRTGLISRNAIADDANSAAPFAPNKGLPFGIGDEVCATVTNRARSDSLAYKSLGRGLRGSKRNQRSRECERK